MTFDPTSLTRAEEFVVQRIGAGEAADFTELDLGDEAKPPVRAAFVRHLMLGLPAQGDAPWPVRLPGVRVKGALIEGALDLADCLGAGEKGLPTLVLEDCDIPDGIDLSYARLARLSLNGSRFPRLTAFGLRLDGPLWLTGVAPAEDGENALCEVFASSARIAGDVEADRATLRNDEGRDALVLEDATISGNVLLDRGFSCVGRASLLGADIGGDLTCSGGVFLHPDTDGTGQALLADGARIRGDVWFSGDFRANGVVSLLGAVIGGDLDCDGGQFTNPSEDGSGTALMADSARIAGSVTMRAGFVAKGVVSLFATHVESNVEFEDAVILNGGEDILSASGLRVGDGLRVIESFEAPEGGLIDLSSAHCDVLTDDLVTGWGGKGVVLNLDGFTYDHLEFPAGGVKGGDIAQLRINRWLKRTPKGADFAPQPYEQLAKRLNQQGHVSAARRVSRAARSGVHWSQPNKPLAFIGWLVWALPFGFGLAPARAAFVAVVLYLAGVAGASWLNGEGHLVAGTLVEARAIDASYPDPSAQTAPPPACGNRLNPWLYAMDVAIGPVDLGEERICRPARTPQTPSWVGPAHAAYALLALVVATLTLITVSGVMRRDIER